MTQLKELQSKLSESIKRGDYSSFSRESLIAPKNMSVESAIEIYTRNYRDGISIHFQRVFKFLTLAIGPSNLSELTEAYLSSEPSLHYDLRFFGAGFAPFLKDNVFEEDETWLSDLASLDWLSHELAFVDDGMRAMSSSYDLPGLIDALDSSGHKELPLTKIDAKTFRLFKRGSEVFLKLDDSQ